MPAVGSPRGILVRTCAAALGVLASGCGLCGGLRPVSHSLALSRQFCQLGVAAIERNQWAEAERFLSQAVQACPEDSEARRYWAEVLWQQGDRAAAAAQLEQLSRLRQADVALHVRLAEMRMELGQLGLAEHAAQHAIDLDPKSSAAWAARARLMRSAGRTRQALADYHRALGLAPEDQAIAWQIAELYRQLGKPQRALAALNSLAGTYTPGEEPQRLFYEQGLAYTALGRYDDAVESLSRAAIRTGPTAEILFRLAEAEHLAGRADRAAAAAREALALDPRHEPSRQLLGHADLALHSGGPVR